MKKRLRIAHRLRIAGALFFSVLALVVVVVTVAWSLDYNVVGWALSSATPVVKILGDRLPAISTRYGKIQLRSHQTPKGLEMDVDCADCQIRHHLIAAEPFTTSDARVNGLLNGKHFVGTATVEGIQLGLDLQWDGETTRGTVELPTTPIADLYRALRSIVPEAERATITGTVSGKGFFSWPDFEFVFEPKISNFTVSGLFQSSQYRVGEFHYRAKDEQGQEIEIRSGEGSPNWLPLGEVGRYLPDAILAIEDQGFFAHQGYLVKSMVEASRFNKKKGEVKRGGSTLTQQLAKNLFLTDERTYARKFRELLYAVELDKEVGKSRELELYVNIVEWGPGVFGAKAAAQTYFRKLPSMLRPEEAAWLASILRSPKRAYQHQFQRDRVNEELIQHALEHMQKLSPEERAAALARPVNFGDGQHP